MRILVTGAAGFVGREVCRQVLAKGFLLRKVLRSPAPDGEDCVVGDLQTNLDWAPAMAGVDAVIHLAARVHQMRESLEDPDAVYRAANVEVTRRLLEHAAAAGVKRFVFVSSIKVNGEVTAGQPFRETDTPAPQDPYGRSKLEAEELLRGRAATLGIEWVVVRPTLVYGTGAGGNFLRLMRAIKHGLPFPLACATAPRAMVGVENLAALLLLCCQHPAAAGQVFLAADCAPGTAELIRQLSRAMGRKAHLLPLPLGLLGVFAGLPRIGPALRRLTEALQADAAKAHQVLGWIPHVPAEDGLQRMATAFMNEEKK